MRSLKAPARDDAVSAAPDVKHGAELFAKIGCNICHVDTIVTGKSPASPGGPGLHPDAVENRTIHPYSDFLLHNVGTGDGIAIALVEHFGRERVEERFREERAAEGKAPSEHGRRRVQRKLPDRHCRGRKAPKPGARHTLCPRQDQDRSALGITPAFAPDARRVFGPTRRCHPPPPGGVQARHREVPETEARGPTSAPGVSAIAVAARDPRDVPRPDLHAVVAGAGLTPGSGEP